MAALEPQYMTILKKVLAARFVPFLPPLLGNVNPADHAAKQLSRAFSAFVLHKLLDITPQVAAASVVDDFNDKGIVKVLLGIAKGKKFADKRATEAKRDWDRQKQRLLKQNG